MAISYDDITAGSNQTVYNFNFDYIEASDVKVKLNGNDTTAYTLSGAKQVTLNAAPTQGTIVRVYRETNSITPEKNFVSGSTLKAEELNANFKQALYVTQETTREVAESNAGNVITQVTNAVNTANAASTAATNAENTANGIAATANSALTTANTASTNASTALTNVSNKADIGANISTFANDSNYISKGTNNTLPADVIINSNQNITTSGSLTAGTTTTGSTTSQDLTITDNLTLSSGNADNKGLIFPTDIGGGTGDKAFIRYYVDGTGEDTRLHIGSENDSADDIYLQAGLVHTSGNFTVNGTCTANSFSGDGSNLTGLITGVRQVKEGSSTGTSSRTSSSYATKASVSLTNTASTSRVLVISTYRIWGSTPYSAGTTSARTTRGNDSTFSGNTYDEHSSQSSSTSSNAYHTSFLWDVSTSSGTREYKIRYNRSGSGTGYISSARIMAIEFRPT